MIDKTKTHAYKIGHTLGKFLVYWFMSIIIMTLLTISVKLALWSISIIF